MLYLSIIFTTFFSLVLPTMKLRQDVADINHDTTQNSVSLQMAQEIDTYLESVFDDHHGKINHQKQRRIDDRIKRREFCCGTSRSLYCPECFRLIAPSLGGVSRSVKRMPFLVDIILTDRRASSSGVHAAVLAKDFVNVIDYERGEELPLYKSHVERKDAYVLFPCNESVPIVSVANSIKKLVVLDCKWTKTSIKDHPSITQLPKVHLSNPPLKSQFYRWHSAGKVTRFEFCESK